MKQRYRAAFFCRACWDELTWNQKMNSHGVCPYCATASGNTIVNCYTSSVPVDPPPPRSPSTTWWDRVLEWLGV